jgi:hypothetical protein
MRACEPACFDRLPDIQGESHSLHRPFFWRPATASRVRLTMRRMEARFQNDKAVRAPT